MDFVPLITQATFHAFAVVATMVLNVHFKAQIVPIYVKMEVVVCQFIRTTMDIYVTVYLVLLEKTAKVKFFLVFFLILYCIRLLHFFSSIQSLH